MDGDEVITAADLLKNKLLIGAIILLIIMVLYPLMSHNSEEPEINLTVAETTATTSTSETMSSTTSSQPVVEATTTTVEKATTTTVPPYTRKYSVTLGSCKSLSGFEQEDCFLELAVKNNDSKLCYNLNGDSAIVCLRHFANQVDPLKCDVFTGNSSLLFTCVQESVFLKNQSIYCGMLPEADPLHMRSICYLDYIFYYSSEKISDCNLISDTDLKAYCFAIFTAERQHCDQIEDPESSHPWLAEKCRQCVGNRIQLQCRLNFDSDFTRIKDAMIP